MIIIVNGSRTQDGGGIKNGGDLILDGVEVSNNAVGNGISQNCYLGDGGGILNFFDANLELIDSYVHHNSGFGLMSYGSFNMVRTTMSHNKYGLGTNTRYVKDDVVSIPEVAISNSTVAYNEKEGIFNNAIGSTMVIDNSTVVHNGSFGIELIQNYRNRQVVHTHLKNSVVAYNGSSFGDLGTSVHVDSFGQKPPNVFTDLGGNVIGKYVDYDLADDEHLKRRGGLIMPMFQTDRRID